MRKIKTKPYIKVLGLGLLVFTLFSLNLLAQDISEPIPEINDERMAEAYRRFDVAREEFQNVIAELRPLVDSLNERSFNWRNLRSREDYIEYGNRVGWVSGERAERLKQKADNSIAWRENGGLGLGGIFNWFFYLNNGRIPTDFADFIENYLDEIDNVIIRRNKAHEKLLDANNEYTQLLNANRNFEE